MQKIKVLLVQLASNGDCLFVTAIAKQIKEIDYPGCELTWLIGSRFTQVISNNPYVDNVIQIPLTKIEDIEIQRAKINEHIANAGGYNKFDKIFVTDATEENKANWFGTTRSSLFRSYPHPLKINPQPLIYLTDTEKTNVSGFILKNKINPDTFNIIFECSPQSGQSSMTFQRAKAVAEKLIAKKDGLKFILTSNQSFVSNNPNIIDGSVISWRENAELANHCHLLVGCSSGISWLCTSNWTKPIQSIQVINPDYRYGGASMKMDFKFYNIDVKKLIELGNPSDSILEDCILAASSHNFDIVRKKYDTNNDKVFLNYRFIKEARIPIYEKLWFLFRYLFGGTFLLGYYRGNKPGWFTPKNWFQKLIKTV